MSEEGISVGVKIRDFVYDNLYFKRDMELYSDYVNRVNNGETISVEAQQVYNDVTGRLMQYNMRLEAQNTNIWEKYEGNTAATAVTAAGFADDPSATVDTVNPNSDQLPGNIPNQSGAVWYDQKWREIAAANPTWSEQQVYDELSRQIGEANWNTRYQNIMADIANSSTPVEREQKIKYYESELTTFQASGIDVGNDIAYLRETQGIEGEASVFNFHPAPDETTWVEPELTEQRKSEGLTLDYNPLGQLWLVDASGNPTQEEAYRFSKQLEHINGFASNLARTFIYNPNESVAENAHKFFDMAGFAPGAGAIPDLANSALYFTEGNYKEAGWSALAAIPGIGDGFAAARITNKAVVQAERRVAQDISKIANARNYRELFLKESPGMPNKYQVHHTLPQKYEEILNAAGKNIHETQYLKGIDPDIHRLITKEWQQWGKSLGRTPTAQEVVDFTKEIDIKYSKDWYKP